MVANRSEEIVWTFVRQPQPDAPQGKYEESSTTELRNAWVALQAL